MLNWDAEKRRLRTLTGTDAARVQRLMGRSGGCSPGGSYGKRFQANHEASLDIPAFAVRPTRRTDRRVAPAAVRPPERPINLCRRSSASYMFFVPPPVSESQKEYLGDFRGQTAQIRIPVLFFAGKTDWMVGPGSDNGVAFPEMILWKSEVGHVPFVENPCDLEKAITTYLQKFKF